MSTITTHTDTDSDFTTIDRVRVWTVGLAAGVVAAAATSLAAVIATALGADLAIGGEQIPTSGFAMLTFVGAIVGSAIAKVAQRTDRPHRTFVRTTVVLTALSLIPDVVADATWSTRVLLGVTHLIAAAIIVPALASRVSA